MHGSMQLKDTYGEDPVRGAEGYQDRAAGRYTVYMWKTRVG